MNEWVLFTAIIVVGIVSISASVVYFKSIKLLLLHINTVSEIGKEERASMQDRLQSKSFAEYKNAEIIVEKIKKPQPKQEDMSHIEPC